MALLATPALGADEPDALQRGRELLERGRILSAEEALREAVALAPDSAEAHLLLGRALAARGDAAGASDAFARAAELGAEGPELDAARGIAYYEIGEIERAREYLRRALAAQPDLARARLHLGLADLAAGDAAAAAAEFEALAADPGSEDRQIALYDLGMAQLRARNPEAARASLRAAALLDLESPTGRRARVLAAEVSVPDPPRRWSLSGNLGFLYDDNVTTTETDLSTGSGDGAFAVDLSGAYRLLDSEALQLEAGYDFSQTAYFRLGDFDQQVHGFHLDASREIGQVDAGLGYRFTLSTLGGDRFVDIHELRPTIGYAVTPRWYSVLSPRARVKRFHEDSRRDAVQAGLALDSFVFFDDFRSYGILGLDFEDENASGAEFDYLGFGARAGLRYPFSPGFLGEGSYRLELDYAFRFRDYRNVTPSIGARRDDRIHSARFRLARAISEHTEVRLDYEHTTSDSNLPSVDYGQNVVGLGVAVDL